MNLKTTINNFESEINYLVNNEQFERKEAIQLVLLMANLEEIITKLE